VVPATKVCRPESKNIKYFVCFAVTMVIIALGVIPMIVKLNLDSNHGKNLVCILLWKKKADKVARATSILVGERTYQQTHF
jgi:uncharacterized RDD family membrane protein YckC